MQYYILPHPFEENEEVIFGKTALTAGSGSDSELELTLWKQYMDSKRDIPPISRDLISSKDLNLEEKLKDVKEYEKNLNKNTLTKLVGKPKSKIYTRLGLGWSFSYLAYFALGPGAWSVANFISEDLIGHGAVSTLAKVSFCVIPGIFSTVKNIGLPIIGNLLGIGYKSSIAYRLNNIEKPLVGQKKIVNLFDSSIKGTLLRDMGTVTKSLYEKSENNEVAETLDSYIEEIGKSESYDVKDWEKKFKSLVEKAEKVVEKEDYLTWGDVEQLKEMQGNVLAHMKNDFVFAPLKLTSPETEEGEEGENKAKIKQAKNLKKFLDDPNGKKIRRRIYSTYQELQKSSTQDDLSNALTQISDDFERLFSYVSRYDFGGTTNINDRGSLKEFYYNFHVKVGKLAEKLRKGNYGAGYEGINSKELKFKMNKHKLIRDLEYETDMLLQQAKHKHPKHFMNQFRTKVGKMGVATSALVLASIMALSGVHIIKPHQYLQQHIYEIGYKGKFIGEKADTLEFEDKGLPLPGKNKLFLTMPRPFKTTYKVDMQKEYDVDVFYPIREFSPEKLMAKIKDFWAGDFGQGYEGINFNVKFKVKDAWKTFNGDGKGELRLEQLISNVVQEQIEEKNKEFRENLHKQDNKTEYIEVTKHMMEMVKSGSFKEKIPTLIYPSPFSRMSYGTVHERYTLGFEYLQNRLEDLEKKPDSDEEWQAYISDFMGFIEGEDQRILEETRSEMEDIRLNTLEFKRLIDDIEGNYGEIMEKYPSLISNLYQYALNDYLSTGTMDIIKQKYQSGEEDFLTEGILERLQEDETLNKLVEITEVERSTKSLMGMKINSYIKKTKDLF